MLENMAVLQAAIACDNYLLNVKDMNKDHSNLILYIYIYIIHGLFDKLIMCSNTLKLGSKMD